MGLNFGRTYKGPVRAGLGFERPQSGMDIHASILSLT